MPAPVGRSARARLRRLALARALGLVCAPGALGYALPGMPESRSLRPLGGWDLVSRGRFEARHDGHIWTVDLDYFDFGEKLHLYRDGVEVDVQKSPAKFALGQRATIRAAMGLLGMRQVELVVEGETTTLTPVDGTAEAWRLRLARERPEISRRSAPSHGPCSWRR